MCTACGYAPEKDQEERPGEPVEDCPQCGGQETVEENDPMAGGEAESDAE